MQNLLSFELLLRNSVDNAQCAEYESLLSRKVIKLWKLLVTSREVLFCAWSAPSRGMYVLARSFIF